MNTVDRDNEKHDVVNELFSENYILQSPDQIRESKIGVCWDQVELERDILKDCKTKSYFMAYYDGEDCPSYTFLVVERDGSYYWCEHSWNIYRGIHRYDSLGELLKDVSNKQVEYIKGLGITDFNIEQFYMYEYGKPKYGISATEFYRHCEGGDEVDVGALFSYVFV